MKINHELERGHEMWEIRCSCKTRLNLDFDELGLMEPVVDENHIDDGPHLHELHVCSCDLRLDW